MAAIGNGFGGVLQASPLARVVTFDAPAVRISIYNRGPADMAIAWDVEAAELDALCGEGNALVVESGRAFDAEIPAGAASFAYRVAGDEGDATANLFAQGAAFDRATAGLREFADILTLMAPSLPGCPDALKAATARQVWRDFCKRTCCWVETVSADLVAGTSRYALTIPANAELVKVVSVVLRNAAQVAADGPGRAVDASDEQEIVLDSMGVPTVLLVGIPVSSSVAGGLTARVALCPLPTPFGGTDAGMPQAFTEWAEYVVAGAVAQLAAVPKRPWSSPDLFALNQSIYRSGINRAKGIAARGHGAGCQALRV